MEQSSQGMQPRKYKDFLDILLSAKVCYISCQATYNIYDYYRMKMVLG